MTYPHYLALLALRGKDGLAVQELARILELEGATTTPLLQRLEKLDLVSRQRSSEDERRVYVFPTKKGKGLRAKATKIPEALGCALGIDEKRARKLIAQLNEFKSSLR